jgi:membrane associated rhomboid family serine protease
VKKRNGHKSDADEELGENVIKLPTLAERDRLRREQEKKWKKEYKDKNKPPPAINLPPYTKALAGIILLVHCTLFLLLDEYTKITIFNIFGFTPNKLTSLEHFSFTSIISPFTYCFLHGSWSHLMINLLMLLALGTGIERWLGGKKLLIIFFSCSVLSLAFHLIFNFSSQSLVVGASGGLSGLFASIIILIQRKGIGPQGKYGIWPFVAFWVLLSLLFGALGGPSGENVAWAAHIGGFLSGLLIIRFLK